MAHTRRDGRLALLQIDLDRFKTVNDNHGHEAGDLVLREVARILERNVRRSDIVSRMGGDEFSVLLSGVESPAKANEIAGNIIGAVDMPINIGGGNAAHIGASIGIAILGEVQESPSAFLRRADLAMYAAKQAGRGCAYIAPVANDESAETAAA
jgi:diguanylate cyclase (GGDEF)-like protein